MFSSGLYKNVTRRNNKHDESCYCDDTIQHLKYNEVKFTYPAIKVNFYHQGNSFESKRQNDLKEYRRRTMEWMISIQDYFTNCEETLEMAGRLFDHIFYIDYYSNVSNSDISSRFNDANTKLETEKLGYKDEERLHLVALTCYFLSCKFWERFPPKLNKLVHLTEYDYSPAQLLKMEQKILMMLSFDLKIPLISQYIEFYMFHETNYYSSKIVTISHYLTNLTLTSMTFTNCKASSLAAVILTMAKMLLNSFASNNNEQLYPTGIYDQNFFALDGFHGILNDVWQIFYTSLTQSKSFKLQKKKFSEQKYSYLYLFLEGIDLQILELQYENLTCQVKNFLMRKQ